MTQSNPDHAQVKTHPPLIFLGYLIAVLVLNWLMPLPEPWLSALRITGMLAVIAGLLLAGSAFAQMRRARTSPDPHQPVSALVTSGPYRFTRNPIYLGFLLIYLGFGWLDGTLWGLIAAPLLIWTVTQAVIQAEELYLSSRFGPEYAVYRSRVRRWI